MTFEAQYQHAMAIERVAIALGLQEAWYVFDATPFAEYMDAVQQRGATWDGRYLLLCTECFAAYCRANGTHTTLED